VILPTDIPTRAQVELLLEHRAPASVSIYVPTDPASNGERERIEFGNLAGEATSRLREKGEGVRVIRPIEDELADFRGDEDFWRHQARSLALFAAPDRTVTFRLANRLLSRVEVSDRFYVKPLLRALTFPHVAFVLALAQGSVRLIEVAADIEPAEVKIDDLPSDVASAVGKASISDRAPVRRVQGTEGQKVRIRQYARQVDQALRPFLSGLEVPLILASTEPIDSIFRSVNTYPYLSARSIPGNPEASSDAELAASARAVLDEIYEAELREIHERYGQRTADGRAFADVAHVARAATYGAVDTLLVDIDAAIPGWLDEQTGAVRFAEGDGDEPHGVTDELTRRAWSSGARVLAVRREDIPGDGPVAAILRYPL
jgi:hypothetical protein